jgi:hypothetical protein
MLKDEIEKKINIKKLPKQKEKSNKKNEYQIIKKKMKGPNLID